MSFGYRQIKRPTSGSICPRRPEIQKGDLILRADLEGIQSAGCRTVTPVVITGAGGAESVELLKTGPVHIGDAVLKVHY